jgi:methylaspartate mutase epsilon subunit
MELTNRKLDRREFAEERMKVLGAWPTGRDAADFERNVAYQQGLAPSKRFSNVLREAGQSDRTLRQPRAGVALIDSHIELLQFLESSCDVLPTTIDAYTRLNRYSDAANGILRSQADDTSLLNGFPAVNHGVHGCRKIIEAVSKPVQVRHGTPDARLLAEITLAAGFTAFEGGGISYNVPYSKNVSLEASLRHWQYCDRLIGLYEEEGVRIDREPFGPLSGTLVPPFISHCVAIIEGLLALTQGVKCLTLGYGQAGNLVQDVAAIRSLRELAHEYFQRAGHQDYQLSTVFHQWMGGFPENEAMALGVISWGAATAALSRATKVIVKTPHEASGVPTKEANRLGLEATTQLLNMACSQSMLQDERVTRETEIIKAEVRTVLDRVFALGDGDVARGAARAFQAGVLDIPFAPAACNAGRLLPVRDDFGAVRVLDFGTVPMSDDLVAWHRDAVARRGESEGRAPSFQMVVDDVYAISEGHLVGRPR